MVLEKMSAGGGRQIAESTGAGKVTVLDGPIVEKRGRHKRTKEQVTERIVRKVKMGLVLFYARV